MVRTYKIGVPVVTMATQSLSQAEFGGAEAQNLEAIVSLQGNGSRWTEKLAQPQVAWHPPPRLRGTSGNPRASRGPFLPRVHLNGSLLVAPSPASRSMPNPEPLLPQYPFSLRVGQSV